MSCRAEVLLVAAVCAVVAGPLTARADAPLTRPLVAVTVVKSPGVSLVLPKKPPVVTAVAPLRPGAPGGQAQLNTQPIPPGLGGPVDPAR